MSGTIASTDNKIRDKLNTIELVLEQIRHLGQLLDAKNINYKDRLENRFLFLNLIIDYFTQLRNEYELTTINILVDYFSSEDSYINDQGYAEEEYTKEFYKILTTENFLPSMDEILEKASNILRYMVELP